MYNIIKRNFDAGRWSTADVAKWVKLNKITAEQYAEITGEEYTAS